MLACAIEAFSSELVKKRELRVRSNLTDLFTTQATLKMLFFFQMPFNKIAAPDGDSSKFGLRIVASFDLSSLKCRGTVLCLLVPHCSRRLTHTPASFPQSFRRLLGRENLSSAKQVLCVSLLL